MRKVNRTSIVFILILALLTVGTLGFHVIEGWPWFQAFYGTLMTVSTIGAEPENQLSHSGRVFNVVLIFFGLSVVGFAIGTLTHGVIQSELGAFFGRRRMEKEISKLQDHFIICGAGRVGRRVAAEVARRGLPLVLVERETARAAWAQEQDFPVIVGDATNEVLTARGMAPNLPIVARASEESAESKLLKAGATTVISPYTFAGQRMARVLTQPHVQKFMDLALSSLADGDVDLHIEEVRVAADSKLAGSCFRDEDIRHRLGVVVLAIRREDGRLEFNPRPDRTIIPGDFLIAMGDSQKLRELEKLAGLA
jgi:voltage-gated potassium channel